MATITTDRIDQLLAELRAAEERADLYLALGLTATAAAANATASALATELAEVTLP